MCKKAFKIGLAALLACGMLAGCGNSQEISSSNISTENAAVETSVTSSEAPSTEASQASSEAVEEIDRTNMYRSELTNEWIDKSLENQRPVAVIVDNEKTALDHYGLTQADIVYEIMNSTANDEVTRLMAIVKDWGSITRFGSIRSARPTHFMIAPEYDAVLIHDGGPFYINDYVANPWITNLSGGFARIDNGKPREFTEYVTTGEIESRMNANRYSTEYTNYYPGAHWQFADETAPVDFTGKSDAKDCTFIDLPFPHNKSELAYDEATATYLYSEYGMKHIDPENDNKQLAFTNVIIQCADYTLLDQNGYMQFNIVNENGKGYYITGGKSIPITWKKGKDTDLTKYYDASGAEITLNTGKTYIGFVAESRWNELVLN